MIVFRPFKGEVIIGKITNGTEQGIKSTGTAHFDIDIDIDVEDANDEQLELSSSTTSSSLRTCCWTVLDCMSSYSCYTIAPC